ncbi:hypothetical protein Phum_PHUM025060 [Pediculus humanus corporis]|uniref:Mitochondria-eating protein n=1 Tax=Pediculus humanus subsp. corporis TaxID=121224 RepID=E0VA05_PEDHC|nr:uncharacterized protein Phum_PHUM025060 [Pediculus humanus corporis]EEB10211.1 hypothetical protein Phum_PHUM025060 [Pediculus humanus corporis]
MQWKASRWVGGFSSGTGSYTDDLDSRIGSMTIADVSPRVAVKRIILLYENFQYREAANFINRLSHGTFKVILNDLPIDFFVESMPHSLSILEALYAKVFLSDGLNFSMKLLRPEAVVMQMVKFFSTGDLDKNSDKWDLCGPFVCSCKKLLKVIVLSDHKLKKMVQARKRSLDKAIEGLGQHGLVGTTDETLTNLHDALKVEFQRVVETYKGALQKLEELSLSSGKKDMNSTIRGPAPVQASHQRQLSLKQPEIQERLIKNKTLLNVVEPTLGNHSLDILLGILQRRIEYDKEVLFQFTQLKKEANIIEPNAAIAPVLIKFSSGCEKVLDLMKEVADDEADSSDISGYHSESDSAIMMSGNSPYVSKRARYNFLTRSVRSCSKNSLRPSVELLHHQLSSSSGNNTNSSGTDSPPASLSPVRDDKDSSSGSSSSGIGSSTNGPVRLRQLKHKKLSATSGISWNQSIPSCQGCSSRAAMQVSPQVQETTVLRAELEKLRIDLARANGMILNLQENEKRLKSKLESSTGMQQQQQQQQPPPSDNGLLLVGERLVRCFANLYAQARVDTLDALDNLPQLNNATELKSKILFSLSFRCAENLLATKKDHIRRILHLPSPINKDSTSNGSSSSSSSSNSNNNNNKNINSVNVVQNNNHHHHVENDSIFQELEKSVSTYLRKTIDKFDLTKCINDVSNQIWATLYDYPCLKSCAGLNQYVKDSVRLAWGLVNQCPPYVLEYEERKFRKDMHVRFHTSNQESEQIQTYMWPALLEGVGGPCVHKAVVIT